jgi:small subunit ribosomal protein S7
VVTVLPSTDETEFYVKEGSTVPRKGFIPKREVLPDPIFQNITLTKLINNLMYDGKKGVAEKIVYGAFDIIVEKTGKEAMEVFQTAMNNIMPVLEVKARRIGGATYQVPIEVRPERRQALAMRWLIDYSRKRGERTMRERIAAEILDAANNMGASVKKREDMHKMAEANKAFAHYRF